MYKKLVLLFLISITSPCFAGKGWDKFMAFCGYTRTSSLTELPVGPVAAPLTQQELAKLYGGVFSQNMKDTGTIVVEGAKALANNPDKAETAVQAVSHGTSHGFMYGLFSGPASAIRDGVVQHPVIAGTTVTAGVAAAAYYKFRPLTEQEQQEQNVKKAQLNAQLREAALIEKTDTTADEFRTCLNTHARCGDRAENGLPRRCNSPARRLAQLNHTRASQIAAAFKEYQ